MKISECRMIMVWALSVIDLSVLAMQQSTVAKAVAEQPNIVLILSDDHGWGDVGYHGFDDVMTPNIDRLAKEGTWFSQGYASASVCGPSRAGLLTGVYQQRMGVYGNWDKGGIPERQPTVFELLKKEGYQTCAIGKWHVGAARESLRPNSRDVDFFYGFLWGSHHYRESSNEPNAPKHLSPIYRNTEAEPPVQESNGYLTEMFTDEAVGFIERADRDKPFFVYLAYNAVHHPWDVPQPYIDRVQCLDTHDERKLFAGMLLCLDDGVGAVMDALEKKGVADNTLIVFMGDNGTPRGQGIEAPKQKKRGECTRSTPGPFNGFKGDTYEGGIRVPTVVWWPGKIPAGQEYKHPMIGLDWVATFLGINGVEQPYEGFSFDGVNLLPYLSGKKNGRPHDVLYFRRGEDWAIRKSDWKLAWNDEGSDGQIELFDMVNDPGEWNNLASSQPERAQALKDMFDAWDSALADNQTGKNPKNRNSGYASGQRINVAEFNAAVATPDPPGKKKTETKVPAQGITLEEQLQQAEANAKKKGKTFDAERTTRWFHAKDKNGDGVIDEQEQKEKVPEDWNNK
jgi:arylsulfatase A-like enzyme